MEVYTAVPIVTVSKTSGMDEYNSLYHIKSHFHIVLLETLEEKIFNLVAVVNDKAVFTLFFGEGNTEYLKSILMLSD